jgi:hypothetical protein
MTVAELIKELEKFPENWPIYVPETVVSAMQPAKNVSRMWDYLNGCDANAVEITE